MDLTLLCLLISAAAIKAQEKVVPTKIVYEVLPVSVNGSSETGNCLNITGSQCLEPTTSVLCDGRIPTLELDQDLWADQLLIVNASGSEPEITFDFNGQSDYVGVEGIEIVFFNCQEWNTQVKGIGLLQRNGSSEPRMLNSNFPTITPQSNSCNRLTKVGQPFTTTNTNLSLLFNADSWVYLAEVTFYREYNQTPIDTVYTTATPPIDNSTTLSTDPTTALSTDPTTALSIDHTTDLSIDHTTALSIDHTTATTMGKSHETVSIVFEHITTEPFDHLSAATITVTASATLILIAVVLVVSALLGFYKYQKRKEMLALDQSTLTSGRYVINPVFLQTQIEPDFKNADSSENQVTRRGIAMDQTYSIFDRNKKSDTLKEVPKEGYATLSSDRGEGLAGQDDDPLATLYDVVSTDRKASILSHSTERKASLHSHSTERKASVISQAQRKVEDKTSFLYDEVILPREISRKAGEAMTNQPSSPHYSVGGEAHQNGVENLTASHKLQTIVGDDHAIQSGKDQVESGIVDVSQLYSKVNKLRKKKTNSVSTGDQLTHNMEAENTKLDNTI